MSNINIVKYTHENFSKDVFQLCVRYIDIIKKNQLSKRIKKKISISASSLSYFENELFDNGWTTDDVYLHSDNPADMCLEQIIGKATIVKINKDIIKLKDTDGTTRIFVKRSKRY